MKDNREITPPYKCPYCSGLSPCILAERSILLPAGEVALRRGTGLPLRDVVYEGSSHGDLTLGFFAKRYTYRIPYPIS